MNLIQKIANQIESRVEAQSIEAQRFGGKAFGPKTKDKMNMELWVGAAMGVAALKGEEDADAKWVLRVVALIIAPRGYSETQKLAAEGRAVEAVPTTPEALVDAVGGPATPAQQMAVTLAGDDPFNTERSNA